eukprot:TRINITY_DN2812_c0_g1_i1.p1 TRINITY_DN2812_c0_g1~~TRINITY_DN2812_c0_g1_i1.p1  ORF type:complete len:254 (+),score=60.24 TRINITY_DN2812_c0_g1_i1:75-836(+)
MYTSHKILYFINFLFLVAGGGLLWAAHDRSTGHLAESDIVPKWLLQAGMGVGVFVIVLSLLGCFSVCRNKKMKKKSKCNCLLFVYFTLMAILLVASVGACFMTYRFNEISKKAKDNDLTDKDVKKFDDNVIKAIKNHESQWVDVQDMLKCCGWNYENLTTKTTVTYGTSEDYCNVTLKTPKADTPVCHDKVIDDFKDIVVPLFVVEAVLVFLELLAVLSACWIMSCKSYKEKNAGRYDNMANSGYSQTAYMLA